MESNQNVCLKSALELTGILDNTKVDSPSARPLMRWLQLRFVFDSTAIRLLVKGH